MISLPRLALAACALALFAACTAPPEDPEGTLDRIEGGTMRVGITDNPPWTIVGDDMAGVEVELIERLAERLDATIEWSEGSEQELFGALSTGALDLVIGGLTSTNANAMEATLTHPFHTSMLVIGIPMGATFEDIAEVEVAVERNTEAAALLRKTDAVPVYVDDLSEVDGAAAAVDDWLLEDLGLQDSGVRLSESDHVMAIRPGENGWLVTLEMFLLEDPSLIDTLLEEDTP